MNEFLVYIILAFIQGVSEWFPISSSGHLVLFSYILNHANSVEFDVALHFGTLMAVFVYFGRDISKIIEDLLKGKWRSDNARIGFFLIVSSIPAVIVGLFFNQLIKQAFSDLVMVALGFGITGMMLLIASFDFKERRKLGYWESFIMGIAQAFAILPGVSRSGSTISTGLLLGIDEKTAVRFSFLMAIPAIFGATILEIGNTHLPSEMIWATFVAFVVGLATIHALLKMVSSSKKNLRWFALYVLLLAIGLGLYLIMQ